jgi:hypothetical protein
MRALTLWRPWTDAILYGGKRVENRPWAPWARVVGRLIALHAGLRYDFDGADWMREQALFDPPGFENCTGGAFVGVARVAGFERFEAPVQMPLDAEPLGEVVTPPEPIVDPWAFGPWCWRLDDVAPLSEAIPFRGAQGLWKVPADVEKELRRLVVQPKE